ncbi:spermidine/putrescine ABC transporter substrate-binding protein [Sinorhizobium meliloti]|jgi:spermidine/putrescine transport system substrate-binding protein|uniref:polyamine ABC transporter substrate-binding protein n=1 Tax=Rhizobium meliloti TaxID=382 RepID=UPI000FD32041|nr:spermidine/putrescine ABC transporter substrate-binding protein [Sinorhizobium meliloti]MDW9418711.1 extracellular solute-binding protein [Sinorhizobium meliloti]MDW9484153.1 extracellular solute-binding protein [Sinorhizobium meliloti]MDW9515294.1 extracellular solute-binding protein [Sinorhizobium meliloti]MDW9640136.1 spermidine/putrescine ABC transporter substrate-binding protein [Sinorhizobium meliloti]MDW9670929.1 extracellular solute-binding protein [Sinorhizobium meliloti]
MTKWYRENAPITEDKLADELMRLKRGSVSRRHFLGVTGLGLATAVLARQPGLFNSAAYAAGDLGTQMSIATWPNYHDPATFEAFTAATGVAVEVNVFGSNEEMLAKLQAGGTGWDLFVPTNYTISTYVKLGLIDELDLSKLPNYDASTENARFTNEGIVDGKTYAVPKNWGTTGIAVNSDKIKAPVASWKDFFEIAMTEADGRAMVHDYQLTTIGNALVSLGFSFNSIKPEELAKAEELLIKVKPHLYAINSDYQPSMRATDAWMTMCWTNDGAQLNRDMPEIKFVLGKDGGEIWSDFYAIPKSAANKPAGYALLDYLMTPANAVKEHIANGAPTTDSRVMKLLPADVTSNKIVYPDEAALTPLEFGAAVTLTDPGRAELMARFKSA